MHSAKRLLSTALLAVAITLPTAWAQGLPVGTAPPAKTAGNKQQNTLSFKDMRGKTVVVPKNLERVATISDGFIEAVMTHLGEVRKVVAIGSWSIKRDYTYDFVTGETLYHSPPGRKSDSYTKGWNTMKYLNPWLDKLPCVNSPQGNIISYEALAKANPQLVILRVGDCTVGAGNVEILQKTIDTIESMGFPLAVLYSPTWYKNSDLSTIKDEMATIGRAFGKEKEGIALAGYLSSTVDMIQSRTKNIPEGKKTKVLMLGLHASVRKNSGAGTAYGIETPESYIVEKIVNAKSVFRDKGSEKVMNVSSGKILNVEQIYALDPDVIILPTAKGYHPPRELLESPDFALLSELRAIKSRKVYSLPWTPMNCGRRVEYPLDMLVIAKAAYPEQFKDIKVHEFALKFYKDVYKVDDKTAKGLRSTQWLDWTVENDF